MHKFPSIYIIGAQKSGTTTLYSWLKQDQRIQFPKIKETHFFSTNYRFGKKWYLKQFDSANESLKMEIDPSYLFYQESLQRILRLAQCPKFVVILRKPIERAYSHYLMSKYRGYEKLTFFDALDAEHDRLTNNNDFSFNNFSYLKRSEYCNQLKYLLSITSKDNCHFISFTEAFNTNSRNTLKELYQFMGLDYENNININIISNQSHTYKSRKLRDLIYKDNSLRNIFKYIIPFYTLRYNVKRFIDKINYSENNSDLNLKHIPVKYIQWNNFIAEKTEEITKLNLEDWKI